MSVKSVDDNVEIREVNIYNFTSSGFWDQNCNTPSVTLCLDCLVDLSLVSCNVLPERVPPCYDIAINNCNRELDHSQSHSKSSQLVGG